MLSSGSSDFCFSMYFFYTSFGHVTACLHVLSSSLAISWYLRSQKVRLPQL